MRSALRPRAAMAAAALSSLIAQHEKFGAPTDVIELLKQEASALPAVTGNQVAVSFLAAPINPADINMVEGVYGIKNPMPNTPGNEGVARVDSVGSGAQSLRAGDWVIPLYAGFGTWRQRAVIGEDELIRVPSDVPVEYAATMAVNPSTAYRMLRDFGNLKPGDVVMQNGANSMVGLAVIQMARQMGIKTVNIVRSDRPEVDQTLRLLTNLGGDVNVTDKYVNTHAFNEVLKDLGPCRLAFNCVGGELVTEMARCMDSHGTIVTYGGMSKRPINVPLDLLASKNMTLAGFWVTEWYKTHARIDRAVMIADIANMIRQKNLTLFFETHDFDDFHWALKRSLEPFAMRKVVLRMDYPDRLVEHDARPASDFEVFDTTTV